jgi:hypothetical protein
LECGFTGVCHTKETPAPHKGAGFLGEGWCDWNENTLKRNYSGGILYHAEPIVRALSYHNKRNMKLEIGKQYVRRDGKITAPLQKSTHAVSDALLIAHYGTKQH